MPKQFAAMMLLLLCAGVAGQPASACGFLFDTVDASESGMGAALLLNEDMLVVTSDGYRMVDCRRGGWPVCFTSPYMRLAIPEVATEDWSDDGTRYERASQRTVKVGERDVPVAVIRSVQENGGFEFYYSDVDGLVGWKHDYVALDGERVSDVLWFQPKQPGESGCRLKR
ncbi:hypothetical protein LK996_02820 [Lysobacter sp. A6]|uniref:Lipoprotein n=1 Tax=Noviluteimonas lactosilytica TaxID=2888523 RepID=A0ABS8JEK6_9GAMM|nr:hypothetical protein [Lysobacter lactosilyticus]MCC8362018.1 hypothetical protein [Lysobacter lactosilyticus]